MSLLVSSPHSKRALVAIAVLALAVAVAAGALAASFHARDPGGPLNPSGEVAPDTSEALTVVAFGDSKGRTAVFEAALEAARSVRGVLVILGDLVEQDSDFEFRYASELVARARALGVTTFVVIGNHEGFDRHDNLSRERYEKFFGPPVSWFRTHGVLFVAIDTADEKSFPAEQAARVAAILAAERPRSREAVILTHVAPRAKRLFTDKRGYVKQLEPADSDRLLDLAARYRCRLVLAGHYHGTAHDQVGETAISIEGTGGAPLDDPAATFGYSVETIGVAGDMARAHAPVENRPGLERVRYLVLRHALAIAASSLGIALASLFAARSRRSRERRA